MKHLTIRSKIVLLSSVCVALALVSSVLEYRTVTAIQKGIDAATVSSQALRHHLEADMMHDALRADVLASLLATTPEQRDRVAADLEDHANEFRSQLRSNSELPLPDAVKTVLAAAGPDLEAYITHAESIVRKSATSRAEADAALPAFMATFARLEDQMSNLSDAIEANARESESVQRAAIAASLRTTWLVALGAIVGMGLFAAYMTRSITGPMASIAAALRQGSDQVLTAASESAEASHTLADGASKQAASVEETSASIEELASMTRRNAESATQAARLMSESAAAVDRSNRVVNEMVEAMSSIRDASGKVSRIIRTIDEIAFQTNILALNAAVEAARAGEAGAGFAVVADEVRNLAQRSARAAKDSESLIEESISSSVQGTRRLEEVVAAIRSITDSVLQAKQHVEEVSEASVQQSQGIDQVSHAVVSIERITQSTAATAEQTAASSETLQSLARDAMQEVGRLEAMVVGQGLRVAARTPARPRVTFRADRSPESVIPLAMAGNGSGQASYGDETSTGTFANF